ncbi:hypothetical protein BZG36_01667 [Bifiguratus adelaidae]|uniref:O-fucosyltransferase family protein n=1 Tax=Bifiguratus adelaidae TaxID=1938954 RepID=A0A261Y4E5_9FUNG|nr:hypothetical protein BZG36_01667 [Bifiguratus adelaidae]
MHSFKSTLPTRLKRRLWLLAVCVCIYLLIRRSSDSNVQAPLTFDEAIGQHVPQPEAQITVRGLDDVSQEVVEGSVHARPQDPERHNALPVLEQQLVSSGPKTAKAILPMPRFDGASIWNDPDEKFLSYLPHSGLSNQQLALTNALLLAYELNRTLILPPAYLGVVAPWKSYYELERKLGFTKKIWEQICVDEDPELRASSPAWMLKHCDEFNAFVAVKWSWLYDLSPLRKYIRMVDLEGKDVKVGNILKQFRISRQDTYIQVDEDPYDWLVYDDPDNIPTGTKYKRILPLSYFGDMPHKLIQLNSAFGTRRVRSDLPEHKGIKNLIVRSLIYKNDILTSVTSNAVSQLGGQANFISIHVRTGDPMFEELLESHIDGAVADIASLTGYARRFPVEEASLLVLLKGAVNSTDPVPRKSLEECKAISQERQRTGTPTGQESIIYIATNHKNPSNDPHFALLYHHFPCIFTLADLPPSILDPLDTVRSPLESKKPMRSILIPLVDGMIAGHASKFYANPKSTFSWYIKRMYERWSGGVVHANA